MRRALTLLGLLLVLAGALTATALATRYSGRTSRGNPARVTTSGGRVRSVVIGWRMSCTGSRKRLEAITRFLTPFGHATRTAVRDGGPYVMRRAGYTADVRVHLTARRVDPHHWTGRFRGSAVVHPHGGHIARCRVATTWNARSS